MSGKKNLLTYEGLKKLEDELQDLKVVQSCLLYTSSMRKDYEELLVNKGRQVQVLEPGNEHMGTALGINAVSYTHLS